MTSETDAEFVEREWDAYLHDTDYDLDGDILERLFALSRRGAAVQWRPIEEAPKDGTFVLTFVASGDAWCPTISRWNGDGWGDEGATFHVEGLNMPTHWMPLPPPPEKEKQNDKG